VREDEEFEEEEIEDDDPFSRGLRGNEGWYEEEVEVEEGEFDDDEGLALPDAEQLFGKRRAARD
jgi:hypothetical protein